MDKDLDSQLKVASDLLKLVIEEQHFRFVHLLRVFRYEEPKNLELPATQIGQHKKSKNCGVMLERAQQKILRMMHNIDQHENFLTSFESGPPPGPAHNRLKSIMNNISGLAPSGSHTHNFPLEELGFELVENAKNLTRVSYLMEIIIIYRNGGKGKDIPKWQGFAADYLGEL